ncbi:hypothetical protein [Streptomyces orinoci]|uniref:Integral membrane protein n=1 Tax=Streptomyces orinoci TaxID=67339 RepID=A0ABV3K3L6_STRON|nr:hypothetical protein [Streptomyces orinoci]
MAQIWPGWYEPPKPAKAMGFGTMWPAAMAMLAAEAVLAGTVGIFAGLTQENTEGGYGGVLGIFMLGILLALLGAVCALLTTAVVVPSALLARWTARRAGRADGWAWCLGVVAALVTTAVAVIGGLLALAMGPAAPLTYLVWWLALMVLLAPATLTARAAQVATAPRVMAFGGVGVLAVVVVGAVLFATGTVRAYQPPRLDSDAMARTWSDGHGGTLRLASDGAAYARDLRVYSEGTRDYDDRLSHCTGSGRWSYEAGHGARGQKLSLDIRGCDPNPPGQWEIGGTQGKPSIYYFVGDPDSDSTHRLTGVSG